MYVIFENPGEIDPKMISTFGVNVKPNTTSPIGFFGTGLKYALAVLMRIGAHVTVQSGARSLQVGVSRRKLRDEPFDILTLNRRALPFTTQVGKGWEPWMAYRELRCNALDEGGQVWQSDSAPIPEAGKTRVIVASQEILAVHSDLDKWFLPENLTPVFTSSGCEVYARPSTGFFYRGIFVGRFQHPAMFTYNLTSQQKLTEDRVLADTWSGMAQIKSAWLVAEDRERLETMLSAEDLTLEASLDFQYSTPQETFAEVVLDMRARRVPRINTSALYAVRQGREEAFLPEPVGLSRVEQGALRRATDFLRAIGHEVKEEIVCVESLSRGVLGQALGKKIYLSKLAFEKGTKCLAGTILEEHLHITHSVLDCTRDMQDLLIDLAVGLGEALVGEPL